MTVLLVVLTFAAFLVVDHLYSKKHLPQPMMALAPAARAAHVPAARLRPDVVAGFKVPSNVRYHPGHTWALNESPNLVRVGMDDFAGKLLGKIERIMLPQRGQWIRQGQKLFSIERNGVKVDMVSPIEGSVADINEAIVANPASARSDAYGDGWLVTVQAPDSKTNFRNLMGGDLARAWMDEAASRLRRSMPQFAGALAQDGGLMVDDLGAELGTEDFARLTREFFLS